MTSKETKRQKKGSFNDDISNDKLLILHNDDVHSFEYVTQSLVEICKHTFEQATQCTLITHYKGKCDIKKGNFRLLKPLKDALIKRELNVTID
jgi:ATP-dependent Clp protease adaptor protein ClpS